MDAVTEQWKPISQAPDYEVSSHGRVRRLTNATRGHIGDPIKQATLEGYKTVHLRTNGAHKHFRVHRLVMAAFVGPSDSFVNHKNGVRSDNRLSNLEYCTNQENLSHAMYVLGKRHFGINSKSAKLNDAAIREIFSLHRYGVRQARIAERFGISRSIICRILKGQLWGHVSHSPTTTTPS